MLSGAWAEKGGGGGGGERGGKHIPGPNVVAEGVALHVMLSEDVIWLTERQNGVVHCIHPHHLYEHMQQFTHALADIACPCCCPVAG